jgi:Cu-Zn family superoxide dismutase
LPALLDADGTALIIHERGDDYTTQPTGAAGGRIGCAVL